MKRRGDGPACPCGRGPTFAVCCGRQIEGGLAAPDAQSLMRSRYSAYVRGAADYLMATWHASTRPARLSLDDSPQWIGLEVRASRDIDPDHAEVEFVARYRVNGRAGRLHERSRFVREAGRWYYVDGQQFE